MQGIRQQVGAGVQRLLEVDQSRPGDLGHKFYALLLHPVPVAGPGLEALVAVRDRSHAADPDPAFRIRLAEIIDERKIVRHELIPVVRPGSGIGVVQPEMDDDNVSREVNGIPVSLLLSVGTVGPANEGGSGMTEIADIIAIPKQGLKP